MNKEQIEKLSLAIYNLRSMGTGKADYIISLLDDVICMEADNYEIMMAEMAKHFSADDAAHHKIDTIAEIKETRNF